MNDGAERLTTGRADRTERKFVRKVAVDKTRSSLE